jgi:GAF domain-containing protein
VTEALEYQTAISEVLNVISRSPNELQPVLDTIVQTARRLCGAERAIVCMLRDGKYHLVSHDGATSELVRKGEVIDVISMGHTEVKPFTEKQIQLVATVADQAVIAINNVGLFEEVQARTRELQEALEYQTATSDILGVISRSQTDAQPVFDIIGERSQRLCDAECSVVSMVDGELIRLASIHGVSNEGVQSLRSLLPHPVDRETLAGRAIRSRAVVHVQDVLADPQYGAKDTARASGWRGGLAVPLLREEHVIGAIFVARPTPSFFTDAQVELLKTFAGQAVIAIENVRLFEAERTRTSELTERTGELTETLEYQTATSEILRVISSSPTYVQPTFDAIAGSARRLCEAAHGMVFRFDGELIHLAAYDNLDLEQLAAVRSVFPIPPGRASITVSRPRGRMSIATPIPCHPPRTSCSAQRSSNAGL